MTKYTQLQQILHKELPLHKSRINCLLLLIISLLKVKSVNFEKLAQGFESDVKVDSNIRRIQRFFANFYIEMNLVALLLSKLIPLSAPYALSMDRTNWKFGKKNINILFIGIIYRGICFPILWKMLGDKRGNSNQKERIELLKNFIQLFGIESIGYITADREFIGEEWWKFLMNHRIRFYIRIRKNLQVYVPAKGYIKAYWLINSLKVRQAYFHQKIVCIKGCWVYLSGRKIINDKGQLEFLLIASYQQDYQAFSNYKKRWQIETMFKGFKSAGFNLEDSHITDEKRMNKVLMVVAITFVWAYKAGIFRTETLNEKIRIKKHGRPEHSIFKFGLEWIAQAFLNHLESRVNKAITIFLSCT